MSFIKTRIFSLIALSGMGSGCGYVVHEGYYAFTDSFVAPAILSPDNDLVLDQKLKLSQLLLEKGRAQSALEEAEADLEAGENAIVRLNELKDMASHALNWTKTTTGVQVSAGSADMKTIAAQKQQLNEMLSLQQRTVSETEKNLAAGLIQKQDLDTAVQALNQIKLALLDNEHTKSGSQLLLNQATLGQQSLYSKGSMPMPEQVMSADQLVRVECELIRTEAEMRAKLAEKERVQEELEKIGQLENDLKARPIFKAIESNQDIAFVSYSGIRGVSAGAQLMDCVWGIFNCKKVGRVENIVPGEAIMPDPFGSGQVRGQFLTLNLNKNEHDDAMQSKLLRVRTNASTGIGNLRIAFTK